jgi:transaldolase
MNATQSLHDLGQSLWLDNITRELLDDGTLERYIREYAITGLTSNPSIFEAAVGKGSSYDASIAAQARAGAGPEDAFIAVALEDLRRAADLFRPVFDATGGRDGWVSMEVSPLLADDCEGSVRAAKEIHARADRPNLFVKIPGTAAGVKAIEEAIFAGVPINVTLLFDWQQYLAAANAYLRGIERRLAAGLSPRVASVASLFVSRWDVAIKDSAPEHLRNRLGIAVAGRTYHVYRELLDSPRMRALADAGAMPQRLLWASTSTKDPDASPTLYVDALAAPDTIDTIPEKTLHAYAQGGATPRPMDADGQDADAMLQRFADARIDLSALAAQLQREGAAAFSKSWQALMDTVAAKAAAGRGGDAAAPQ